MGTFGVWCPEGKHLREIYQLSKTNVTYIWSSSRPSRLSIVFNWKIHHAIEQPSLVCDNYIIITISNLDSHEKHYHRLLVCLSSSKRHKRMKMTDTWSNDLIRLFVQQGPFPKHIGIVMDGNRRYARENGVPWQKDMKRGAELLRM